jgi:AraC family transcriptional regulator
MAEPAVVLEKRINRVIEHIRTHLEDELSLEVLADVAGLSAFHFHRLFKRQIGASLNTFVVRQRLERAAKLLQSQKSLRLTQAAFEVGFQSLSDFSRNFKAQYGVAASQWDRRSGLHVRKIRQTQLGLPEYTDADLAAMSWSVQIQAVASRRLVYLRVQNPYAKGRLSQGLMVFLEACANLELEPTGALLGMSLDDPDVTPPERCFYDWALPVAAVPQRLGQLSHCTQTGFVAAKIAVKGGIEDVDQAWQYLYHHWLPQSGFLPDVLPALEVYRQSPIQSAWQHWDLECWLPIKEML